jgi:hypothetical protein
MTSCSAAVRTDVKIRRTPKVKKFDCYIFAYERANCCTICRNPTKAFHCSAADYYNFLAFFAIVTNLTLSSLKGISSWSLLAHKTIWWPNLNGDRTAKE